MANTAANLTEQFRKAFKLTNKDVLRWFPGHMGRGLRMMQQKLKSVDCVIEVHDARVIPVVCDLISSSNRYNRSEEGEYSVMVIGVPNVGKSSLINWLRNKHLNRANAARVGGIAGVTRSVQNRIKVNDDPPVYLLDTPGVLQPKVKDVQGGLKLAICSCLQDHLVGEEVIADYLLYVLNKQQNFSYVEVMGVNSPCDNIGTVLVKGAVKMGIFHKVKLYDGSFVERPNLTATAQFFLKEFREGKLGKIVLDDI